MSAGKRKLALAFSALLAGTAIALAAPVPAQADTGDCVTYLRSKGYSVDSYIKDACKTGDALGGTRGIKYCRNKLTQRGGISSAHASSACTRAVS